MVSEDAHTSGMVFYTKLATIKAQNKYFKDLPAGFYVKHDFGGFYEQGKYCSSKCQCPAESKN